MPNNSISRICGIDPGTNVTGISIIEFDSQTYNILNIISNSYKSDLLDLVNINILYSHGDLTFRLLNQQKNLLNILNIYQPLAIACEAPFFNRLRPGAFGPVAQALSCFWHAAIEYDPNIPFNTYEPSLVKKAVNAHAHGNNKYEVLQGILSIPELINNIHFDINLLTNDARDSIAVAYAEYKNFIGK